MIIVADSSERGCVFSTLLRKQAAFQQMQKQIWNDAESEKLSQNKGQADAKVYNGKIIVLSDCVETNSRHEINDLSEKTVANPWRTLALVIAFLLSFNAHSASKMPQVRITGDSTLDPQVITQIAGLTRAPE